MNEMYLTAAVIRAKSGRMFKSDANQAGCL
jgi:hypothetical protein